jgi:hypothetical protein
LVEYLNQNKRNRASVEDINVILSKVFETGAIYFKEFWEQGLTARERKLLIRIANGEIMKKEYTALQKLIKKDILQKKGNYYDYQVPIIKLFVKNQI